MAWVTATTLKTFVSQTARISSSDSLLTRVRFECAWTDSAARLVAAARLEG